jgi:hypothetical protein
LTTFADHDSGATFVILSKAKGWYIVQKDPDGMGQIVPDQAKSGWVPAGKSYDGGPRRGLIIRLSVGAVIPNRLIHTSG